MGRIELGVSASHRLPFYAKELQQWRAMYNKNKELKQWRATYNKNKELQQWRATYNKNKDLQ